MTCPRVTHYADPGCKADRATLRRFFTHLTEPRDAEQSYKKGIKAKRYKAALQPDYAEKILNVIFWHTTVLP